MTEFQFVVHTAVERFDVGAIGDVHDADRVAHETEADFAAVVARVGALVDHALHVVAVGEGGVAGAANKLRLQRVADVDHVDHRVALVALGRADNVGGGGVFVDEDVVRGAKVGVVEVGGDTRHLRLQETRLLRVFFAVVKKQNRNGNQLLHRCCDGQLQTSAKQDHANESNQTLQRRSEKTNLETREAAAIFQTLHSMLTSFTHNERIVFEH